MSKGPLKYNAIIIDPDLDTRMRLKQATAAVHNFGHVLQVSTFKEALQHLNGTEEFNVVFISHLFAQDEITQFIKEAKETPQGQDSAYILVLKNEDQESSKVAQSVMIGADGLLFEPYSVDQLVEITELSSRVKKERSDAREKAALSFLIKDIMHQIDQIAYIKACQFDVGRSIKKFKEMCAVFETLEPEAIERYYDVALEKFENAPLPKNLPPKKVYKGVSERVRKRMEAKIIAQLEKQREEEEQQEKEASQ